MRVEIGAMLDALRVDLVKEYPLCVDLLLAGEAYRVRKIACFSSDPEHLRDNFVFIRQYSDRFLSILIRTEQSSLIAEAMAYVDQILPDYAEFELQTPFASVLNDSAISLRFVLEETAYPPNPAYVMCDGSALLSAAAYSRGEVSWLADADREELLQLAAQGKLDCEGIGPDLFRPLAGRCDVLWYLLRVSGRPVGYLRAESILHNIYEIGWLYVESSYRGRGYAAELVRAFTRETFAQGAIPRYGYAVSTESIRVAEACGYTRVGDDLICRSLRKL